VTHAKDLVGHGGHRRDVAWDQNGVGCASGGSCNGGWGVGVGRSAAAAGTRWRRDPQEDFRLFSKKKKSKSITKAGLLRRRDLREDSRLYSKKIQKEVKGPLQRLGRSGAVTGDRISGWFRKQTKKKSQRAIAAAGAWRHRDSQENFGPDKKKIQQSKMK